MKLAVALVVAFGFAAPAFADKDEDLHQASAWKDAATVRKLLAAGANPNYIDKNGFRPLYSAAQRGSVEIVQALIEGGADVNAKNETGQKPLYIAAILKHAAVVKLLVEKGADIRIKSGLDESLLHEPTSADVLRVLLDAGLEVDLRQGRRENTPLCTAAWRDDPASIELLLSRGAQVEGPCSSEGTTPLHHAVKFKNLESAKVLLEHGADPNALLTANFGPSGTPLQFAILLDEDQAAAFTKLLLSKGADAKRAGPQGDTPLHLAARLKRLESARMILAAGADPDALRADSGETPRGIFKGSHGLDIDTLYPFTTLVNRFVRARLDPWLKKDEYESAADYAVRMKSKTAKVGGLMGEAFDHLGIWKSVMIGLYDAESETFKLTINEIGDIIVPVPKARARDFKEKFASFAFKPQFAAAGKGWTLTRLEMRSGGDAFVYDSAKQANYKPVVFDVKTGAAVDTALAGAKEIKTEVRKVTLAAADDVGLVPKFPGAARDNDVAVVIGIETYRGLPKSAYSRVDAELMKRYLLALGFRERNIALLTDDKATYIDIKKTLETWLRNVVKPESSVFVYYSGHGAPEAATGEGYIVPFDGDPEYLQDTAYPLKKLVSGLNGLGAKQSVLVLDSCFSGIGGRSVLAKNVRPLVAKTAAPVLSDGVAMMTASANDQISTSSEEFGHGVFTYYFLKAMKDGKKDLAEIYGYARPLVEDEARRQNARQSPTMTPSAESAKGRFALVR